jgi:serine/threonine protein kinase/Tol biopolymer transport system component
MPLSVGDRLGPYEILAPIGAGGMGEVYRAHDSRLDRDVAIKVSNAEFTERFTREARAIAALNHTNICHLYDVGADYLVMEYVGGQDLGAALLRGPMDFEDALPIIQQLIDGIEAAHEKNIIHRDLKPANIKITPEGVVRILDFGLAKAMESPPSNDGSPEISPTFTIGATQAGAILGTAAYMAPEQAKGKTADRRSDIWSFGVILYEMLAGKRLFQGESNVEVLGSVLNKDPDLSAVPLRVHKLLRWCLEKDRKQRLASISDARRLLSESDGTESAAQPAPLPPSRFGKLPWIVSTAALGLGLIAVGALYWRATRPVLRPLVRLDVDLGADVSLPAPSTFNTFAISPDGTRLVYRSGMPTRLLIRRLDQPKATELPGTQGASTAFFSPDGQWVGFLSGNQLNKISVEGGAVVPLGVIPGTFSGVSWNEDGSILFGAGLGKGLVRIPSGGGPPETVEELGKGEIALAYPQLLPGGKAILFAADTALDEDKLTIEVLTLADRRRKIVARGGASPRYVATSSGAGHLVYVNKATLFAIPFDLDKLETRGTAVPVLDDVAYLSQVGTGQFDFSREPSGHGTLVYRRSSGGASATMATLQWVDPTGKKEPLQARPGDYRGLSLSPDGKRVALAITEGGSSDVWVYDPQRDAMTRLTSGGGAYLLPIWSPDGQYVVFGRLTGGGIFQTRADGGGQPQALTESKSTQAPFAFTPDGKRLAYIEATLNGQVQVWTVPLKDQGGQLKAGKPEQFLKSNFTDAGPSFSPDGRWLAYQSNESGKYEVYVRAFPAPSSGRGGKWQVSNNGGGNPRWMRNGHELVYQSGGQIMAAGYTVKGDTFVPDKPRVWIAKLGGTQWDLAPDGKRVVAVTPVETAEATKQEHEVVFLENFFDELRRRAPASK